MRRLAFILAFLALGALATAATTWACASATEVQMYNFGGLGWPSTEKPDWPVRFALATVFWAAALATVTLGPVHVARSLRHRSRNHRGECTACGYTLAGLTICPECGRGTPAPSAP